MKKLAGQVALVTGASSGVGWQTALELAKAGARLCVTARRAQPLHELVEHLQMQGAEATAVTGDITVHEDVERVVRACVDTFGRIDILVNDPGVQLFARFEDLTPGEIKRMMDVNFYGYVMMTRAVLPMMRRQRSGHVMNVLSVFAKMGFPLFSIYAASKHAALGWAESLRLELRGSGIHISNVLLPAVATPFYDVAPTKLGRAPRPAPPAFSTERAARAVMHCLQRPTAQHIPALLQGRLALLCRTLMPRLSDAVIARMGPRLFTSPQVLERPRGNLFESTSIVAGPHGAARARSFSFGAWAAAALAGCASVVAVAMAGGARHSSRRWA